LPSLDECADAPVDSGGRPLSRLTRVQYQNTLADLLNVDAEVAEGFVEDERVAGFEAARTISSLHVEKYLEAARELASEVDLPAVVTCSSGEDCARGFIADFGRRAFRRELTASDVDDLLATWRVGNESSFDDGIRLVIEATLGSPDFLYHVETGEIVDEDLLRLDDVSVASRLSYFLWASMPDDALLDAAAGGSLDLESEARRMLDDPRFENTVQSFYRQWLGLERIENLVKSDLVYPEFRTAEARDLRTSLEMYLEEVHFGDDPSLEALLLSEGYFVNDRLAALYDEEATGAFTRSPGRRGLLEQPGLLALLAKSNQSDPIHRGIFVREQLLCDPLREPPNDVDLVVREPEPGLSTRDRFAEHTSNEVCASCHRLIDGIGFGFEAYDGIGRFRTEDEGVAIDTSGEIVEGGDTTGTFDGVRELSERLAESETVRQCYAKQWFRYALQRESTAEDACSLATIDAAFAESGNNLRELLIQIVTSDAFRHRRLREVAR
ncbi:MAG: DUF1592 domain-containing protein, partial [Myxococcota bacterium]